jgi:hypothetical protein
MNRKPREKDDTSRGSAGDQIAAIAAQFAAELKDPAKLPYWSGFE